MLLTSNISEVDAGIFLVCLVPCSESLFFSTSTCSGSQVISILSPVPGACLILARVSRLVCLICFPVYFFSFVSRRGQYSSTHYKHARLYSPTVPAIWTETKKGKLNEASLGACCTRQEGWNLMKPVLQYKSVTTFSAACPPLLSQLPAPHGSTHCAPVTAFSAVCPSLPSLLRACCCF